MPQEPPPDEDLRALLRSQRTAALGSLTAQGRPFVSMVAFAVDPVHACLVIHVSDLAAHTRHMRERAAVSLLVQHDETAGEPVHALPRATFDAEAEFPPPDSPTWLACRNAYVGRFAAEAEPMVSLADFRFVALRVLGVRLIAGFAGARDIDEAQARLTLREA